MFIVTEENLPGLEDTLLEIAIDLKEALIHIISRQAQFLVHPTHSILLGNNLEKKAH